jgi:hypothetical protein
MERAALIGGIVLAVLVALGAYLHDHVSISFDDEDWDGFRKAAHVAPAPGRLSETYAETAVRIRGAAAVVRVVAEERADVAVTIENPGQAPMPQVERRDGKVIIDGRLSRRIDCRSDGRVRLAGYGTLSREQLPVISIRAPRDLDLGFGGAVEGEIGAAQSLDLSLSGCGDTRAADIAGRLEVRNQGSGDFTAGTSQSADIAVAGSGSVKLGAISESLDATVAGSGDVEAASLNGALDVSTQGSGEVVVRGGAVTDASASIMGSGSVTVAAPVQKLNASIMGSGDISIPNQVGDVNASVMGSGDVIVGGVTGSRSQSVLGSGGVIVRAQNPQNPPAAP